MSRLMQYPCRQRQSSRGFTLIEMMVALTIGLFLVGGLISLLVSTSVARTELDKSARQIENGRYALRMLTQDVQHAGFLGRFMPTGATLTAPDPCLVAIGSLGFSTSPLQVPVPVYGYDGGAASPSCVTNRVAGTDILVVRRASTTAVAVAAALGGEVYLQVSSCADPVTPPPPFFIGTGGFALEEKDCATPAELRKYIVRVYYVSSCNVCTGPNADTIPTLKAAEYVNGTMTAPPTPLVEGIQNLQVEYGIDMDGNGSPDCYISDPNSPSAAETALANCPQPATAYDWAPDPLNHWANVMAVRIHVLARNIEASGGWEDTRTYDLGLAGLYTPPAGDRFKRHVYTTVARAVNVSSRRETP